MSSEFGFSGYLIDEEPRELIIAGAAESTRLWKAAVDAYHWVRPEEFDPGEWFDVENQERTNACVGESSASCVELGHFIATGGEVQLSRSWAYLASQEAGGHLGSDGGADLNAATSAIERGLPLEADFPWQSDYSSMLRMYRATKAAILAGKLFKMNSKVIIESADDARDFVGGHAGAIHIGMAWPGFELINGWEIRDYSAPSRGLGHAVTNCGYKLYPAFEEGWGHLVLNSWTRQWGKNGWCIIKPSAFTKIARFQRNIMIGRSGMIVPAPRPTT